MKRGALRGLRNRRRTDLQLQSFVVVVVDDEADASVLVVRDPERHHAQHLHVLEAAVAAAGQRDLLLYAQVYAEGGSKQPEVTSGCMQIPLPILPKASSKSA